MSTFSSDRSALFAKSTDGKGSKSTSPNRPGTTSTFTTPSARGSSTLSSTRHTPLSSYRTGDVAAAVPKRMNLEKLKEAEQWRVKAVKTLKTSLFGNWQPDYLSAAPYFDKAASLYKAAGAEEQAKAAYMKSAECNEKTSTYAAAAMAYRNAAQIAKVEEEEEAAGELLAREADMWVLQGDVGRAADSLVKAGVQVEDACPKQAVAYCLQGVSWLAPDQGESVDLRSAPLASDVLSRSLNLCLRNEQVHPALDISDKAGRVLRAQGLTSSLYKMYCTTTVLQLYIGDVVAADKTFLEVHLQDSGYIRSVECECAENLLSAAKGLSRTALEGAVHALSRAYLDNSVLKFARRLTVDRISGGLGGEEEEEEEEEEEKEGRNGGPQHGGMGPSLSAPEAPLLLLLLPALSLLRPGPFPQGRSCRGGRLPPPCRPNLPLPPPLFPLPPPSSSNGAKPKHRPLLPPRSQGGSLFLLNLPR
ncbi:soluble nsf attachment protein gamma isoform [Nannochloropsis gaditana]|uniref:Gamma-soluble NSF attachment protein n=1 Tax=Nannochloropsis gaditana TaxID=72520 RepID=W7TN30_9STRA|nr:soluble nsf attachment protein gamma isoform [Nannochloropsis gaditana]